MAVPRRASIFVNDSAQQQDIIRQAVWAGLGLICVGSAPIRGTNKRMTRKYIEAMVRFYVRLIATAAG